MRTPITVDRNISFKNDSKCNHCEPKLAKPKEFLEELAKPKEFLEELRPTCCKFYKSKKH